MILFVLSFAFLYAGKVESVIIDKTKMTLEMWKTSILCKKEVRIYDLADVKDISGYKRGHQGVNVYTLHYNIMVDFKNGVSVKLFETQNREKIIRQVSIQIS